MPVRPSLVQWSWITCRRRGIGTRCQQLATAITCGCRWMRRGRLWERRRCPLPWCTVGICSRSVDAWHQASKQKQKRLCVCKPSKPQTLVLAGHQA